MVLQFVVTWYTLNFMNYIYNEYIQFKHTAYFSIYVVFSFHPNRFTKFSFEGLNDGKILKSKYVYTANVIESQID